MNDTVTTSPFSIGAISNATLRPFDLAYAIHSEIDYANAYRNANIELPEPFDGFDGFDCDDTFWDSLEANEYVEELFDILNDHAPPYCYFGAHEGDGACFGFWPDIEACRESVEYVGDGEPEDGFTGEWLHVNDYSNATLYVRDINGNDSEAWSIV